MGRVRGEQHYGPLSSTVRYELEYRLSLLAHRRRLGPGEPLLQRDHALCPLLAVLVAKDIHVPPGHNLPGGALSL